MTGNIHWTLAANVRDGKLAEISALMTELAGQVEANEPGTVIYESYLNPDKTQVFFSERFVDSAAALEHLGGFGAVAERFMACVEITGFDVYGNPTDELKAAVADFQPTFHTQLSGFRR